MTTVPASILHQLVCWGVARTSHFILTIVNTTSCLELGRSGDAGDGGDQQPCLALVSPYWDFLSHCSLIIALVWSSGCTSPSL